MKAKLSAIFGAKSDFQKSCKIFFLVENRGWELPTVAHVNLPLTAKMGFGRFFFPFMIY
jgi:hypothetical protein